MAKGNSRWNIPHLTLDQQEPSMKQLSHRILKFAILSGSTNRCLQSLLLQKLFQSEFQSKDLHLTQLKTQQQGRDYSLSSHFMIAGRIYLVFSYIYLLGKNKHGIQLVIYSRILT